MRTLPSLELLTIRKNSPVISKPALVLPCDIFFAISLFFQSCSFIFLAPLIVTFLASLRPMDPVRVVIMIYRVFFLRRRFSPQSWRCYFPFLWPSAGVVFERSRELCKSISRPIERPRRV